MPLFGKSSPQEMILEIVLVVVIAFLPSIIYMIGLRYVEKYEREPWGSMATVFLWGATMAVVAVIIVRGMFHVHFKAAYPDLGTDTKLIELIAACAITPIMAELIKPVGLLFVRHDIEESEDGLIYGAISGLGYAATENLLYGIFLISIYGMSFFIFVVFVRSISVVLLNASTSALTGYGVSRATAIKHRTGRLYAFPLFLFAAIGMHSFFNYLMISGESLGDLNSVSFSFLFAISISIGLMTWIYFKIYRLDRLDEHEAPEEEEEEEFGPDYDRHLHERRHEDYHGHGVPLHGRPPPHHHAARPGRDPYDYLEHPEPHRGPPAHDMHHRPPVHEPPPPHRAYVRPHPGGHEARPPRARPVGRPHPPAPPPSVSVEQPKAAPRGRPVGADRKGKVIEPEWHVEEKPKKRSKWEPITEPEFEDMEMDWEEEEAEEEGIEWVDVPDDEPAPAPRSPPSRKKAPSKVHWTDDDSEIKPKKRGKAKKESLDDDDWWFDND